MLLVRHVVRKGQSKKAQEAVEKLFTDPFKPRWMLWQEEAKLQLAIEEANVFMSGVNRAWQYAARKSHEAILRKCVGVEYHN